MADIIRQYGTEYLHQYNNRILPSHRKVMQHISDCRTPVMGGQKWRCAACGKVHYSYHSCRDRHCPRCQHDRCEQWMQKQIDLLLPVPYFLATITVPEPMRSLFRSRQKILYHLLFKASAEALMMLARDKRFLGAQIGLIGILHTWTRKLAYHPHIHFLIPGGGIRDKDQRWKYAKQDFLIHVKPLSRFIRRRFREYLKESGLDQLVSPKVWTQDWVCHMKPVGTGEASVKYLAPYVFRVALSNRNILCVKQDNVTFRYKPSGESHYQTCTLNVHEFLRRFLQHVLPRGFVKIRYFGFLATKKRNQLDCIKEQIGIRLCRKSPLYPNKRPIMTCPECGQNLVFVCEIPQKRQPP